MPPTNPPSKTPPGTKPPPSKATSPGKTEPPVATTPAQVAAERKAKEPFYEVVKDPADGKFHWCLWSGNGRAMARSLDGYDTMKHTLQAIRLIGANATAAKLIVRSHQDEPGEEPTDDAESEVERADAET